MCGSGVESSRGDRKTGGLGEAVAMCGKEAEYW